MGGCARAPQLTRSVRRREARMRDQTTQLGRAAWLGCIALAVGAAAAGENPPDALKQYLSRFARGYSDCGIVSVDGTTRPAVQECVIKSVATKRAFIAR